jgi:hypothetical protein
MKPPKWYFLISKRVSWQTSHKPETNVCKISDVVKKRDLFAAPLQTEYSTTPYMELEFAQLSAPIFQTSQVAVSLLTFAFDLQTYFLFLGFKAPYYSKIVNAYTPKSNISNYRVLNLWSPTLPGHNGSQLSLFSVQNIPLPLCWKITVAFVGEIDQVARKRTRNVEVRGCTSILRNGEARTNYKPPDPWKTDRTYIWHIIALVNNI